MKDLFVNFIGAVCFSFIGYFYVKNRGDGKEGKFAAKFIPTVDKEAQLDDIKRYKEAKEAKKKNKQKKKKKH